MAKKPKPTYDINAVAAADIAVGVDETARSSDVSLKPLKYARKKSACSAQKRPYEILFRVTLIGATAH